MRRRPRLEAEQQLDHLADLVLLRAAISHDGPLDFRRGVLDHRNTRLRGGEQRDAARVSQLQRAAHVLRVEDVFNRDAVGPMLREEPRQPRVHYQQPVGK